jgi:hypothetical protein
MSTAHAHFHTHPFHHQTTDAIDHEHLGEKGAVIKLGVGDGRDPDDAASPGGRARSMGGASGKPIAQPARPRGGWASRQPLLGNGVRCGATSSHAPPPQGGYCGRPATPPRSAVGTVEQARDLATRGLTKPARPCKKAIERANRPDSGRTGSCPGRTQSRLVW